VWDPVAGRLIFGNLQTETLQGTGYFQFNSGSSHVSGFTLDTTVADGGIRTLGSGGPRADAFRAPNGTIAAVIGEFRQQSDGIFRLINDLEMTLANGQPATSYGPGGLVEITPMINSFNNSSEFRFTSIDDVAIDTQGRVVVLGKTQFGSGTISFQESFIIRVTADGQLDTSFAANGYSTPVVQGAVELAIDGSDRIVLAGPSGWSRLNANGNLDTSFGLGGIVDEESFGDENLYSGFREMIALADGSTLTLFSDPYSDNGVIASVIRLNANGSLDTRFGVQGIASIPDSPDPSAFISTEFIEMVLDSQGRIVVGGDQTLRRLSSSGQIDNTFGGGLVVLPASVIDQGNERFVRLDSLAVDSQDRVLFGSTLNTLIGRLNEDGSIDTTLSNDGFQSLVNRFTASFETIFVDAADRLVTVGDEQNNGRISYYRFA
jgi:uncharacterized delta-60 repeat protein